MQRGVRQHEAQTDLTRCHNRGQFTAGLGQLQQYHRRLRGVEQLAGCLSQPGIAVDHLQRRRHQGEGFCAALFALTQSLDGIDAMGVTAKMEPAQPLDRQNFARFQPRSGLLQGGISVGGDLPGLFAPNLRAAGRTSYRLGVKAAVSGVMVLACTIRTERELCHGRIWPVVRDFADD